jgi:hypothetical protein
MNNYFCLKKSLFLCLPNSGIEDTEECKIISVVDVVVDVVDVVVPLLVAEVIDGDVEYLEAVVDNVISDE